MLVFLILLLCATIYMVPGLIAVARRHPGWKRIWLVNLALGFTVLGWVWALRDALRRDAVPNQKVYYSYTQAYGEKGETKRFDLRQLPVTDVSLAVAGLAAMAFFGMLGWEYVAPPANPVAMAAAATVSPQNKFSGWTYSQDSDDRGVVHVSTLMSDDNDTSSDHIPAALIVRQGPGGVSVAIKLDGQFTCSAASGGMIAAQFDGGEVKGVACARRPDDQPQLTASGEDTLFIAAPADFIARLRAAHSLVLSADILNQGVRHTQFSPHGLDLALAGLPATPEATQAAAPAAPAPVLAKAADAAQVATPAAAEVASSAAPEVKEKTPATRTAAKPRPAAHKARQPHYKSWHE